MWKKKKIHNNNKSIISLTEIDHIDHTTLFHFGYENHTQQQHKTLFGPVRITNTQHRQQKIIFCSQLWKKTHKNLTCTSIRRVHKPETTISLKFHISYDQPTRKRNIKKNPRQGNTDLTVNLTTSAVRLTVATGKPNIKKNLLFFEQSTNYKEQYSMSRNPDSNAAYGNAEEEYPDGNWRSSSDGH